METFGRTSKLSKLPTVVSNNKTIGGKLLLARMLNYFEWSDEDASEASIRVAFPSEARKSGA